MLMMKERQPAIRTLEGWARSVLLEVGAIREYEEHGWMKDRADPHARDRALRIARQDPPPGVSPEAAAVAMVEVLESIGDTCPECPPEVGWAASVPCPLSNDERVRASSCHAWATWGHR
jgi:hypothetical protein